MTGGEIAVGSFGALLWGTGLVFGVPDLKRVWRMMRQQSDQPRYKVDRCGACHGSGRDPYGETCNGCFGSGKVCRHPNSDSAAGPAPRSAEVGSFIGGPVW